MSSLAAEPSGHTSAGTMPSLSAAAARGRAQGQGWRAGLEGGRGGEGGLRPCMHACLHAYVCVCVCGGATGKEGGRQDPYAPCHLAWQKERGGRQVVPSALQPVTRGSYVKANPRPKHMPHPVARRNGPPPSYEFI